METLLIALLSGIGFIVAYHTYGRWLGSKIFRLSADAVCPSERLEDGVDYVPTSKSVVFGHHFTSIAGTGPIVGLWTVTNMGFGWAYGTGAALMAAAALLHWAVFVRKES